MVTGFINVNYLIKGFGCQVSGVRLHVGMSEKVLVEIPYYRVKASEMMFLITDT